MGVSYFQAPLPTDCHQSSDINALVCSPNSVFTNGIVDDTNYPPADLNQFFGALAIFCMFALLENSRLEN